MTELEYVVHKEKINAARKAFDDFWNLKEVEDKIVNMSPKDRIALQNKCWDTFLESKGFK